jgi:hypothetical protein
LKDFDFDFLEDFLKIMFFLHGEIFWVFIILLFCLKILFKNVNGKQGHRVYYKVITQLIDIENFKNLITYPNGVVINTKTLNIFTIYKNIIKFFFL